jgi:ATP-binding cassette subfamily B protein
MAKYVPPQNEYRQEEIENKPVDLILIARMWKYLRPYRNWVFVAIGLLLISKIIEAYVPIFIGQISQQILNNSTAAPDVKDSVLATITYSCVWITALLVFGYSLDGLSVYLKSLIGQKALFAMRLQVYEHLQHMPLRYFDQHTIGRLMTRTIHDIEQINQMFTESVVPILGNILLFFCMVTGIFYLDWRLGIILLFILPLAAWETNRFRIYQRKCYELIRKIVSALNTFVQEHLMGASTIRNFGLQKKERDQFQVINIDHSNAYNNSVNNFSYFIASIDFIQSLTLIAVFTVLVIWAPVQGQFQAGLFFTFNLYILMFFRPLADLAERYNVLQSAMAASERVFDVLDGTREDPNKDGKVLNDIQTIDFEDVWFAYENENWILKGFSLKIKKGESIAIVGPTGAGKTSLMSILMRFYPIQKGVIKINGLDFREYTLESLRRQFSVVLQDPVIFSGTIFENITLFQEGVSVKDVEDVVDYIGMRGFIERFPDGLGHSLTERGQSLSLGEMQLIAMARAIFANRSVLILDEATANIDTSTERIIQTALEKILKDKTALVIAHRLSTIRDVNRIIVLNNGVVAESGSHQELLQHGGIYEKLYMLQFRD